MLTATAPLTSQSSARMRARHHTRPALPHAHLPHFIELLVPLSPQLLLKAPQVLPLTRAPLLGSAGFGRGGVASLRRGRGGASSFHVRRTRATWIMRLSFRAG